MLKALAIAWLLLFMGDFLSTFCYHVPEHVFGRLHLQTHHSARKTFRHYAVLSLNINVLLDGILGALPYLVVATLLWKYSSQGIILGLALGQIHVWWRHTTALGWQTPELIQLICHILWITTPEKHWLHHQRTNMAFGDIFSCFEIPAKSWLRLLRWLRWRSRSIQFS
ncbi:sterol desaturase [Pantanalinema rosaneae CENA516]|uniref:sterol desaturase n=1 Tax=Pantanalinema rosaneae TaxID=1620701 RepID=UPI003D6FAEA7